MDGTYFLLFSVSRVTKCQLFVEAMLLFFSHLVEKLHIYDDSKAFLHLLEILVLTSPFRKLLLCFWHFFLFLFLLLLF